MEFLFLLAVMGLTYWNFQLSTRLKNLENKETQNFYETDTTKDNSKTPDTAVLDDQIDRSRWPEHLKSSTAVHTTPVKTTQAPQATFNLESFLGEKLFPILGAVSIVMAIGFFTVWAFANGWIGPMGRIAVGIAFSLTLLGLGEYLRLRYPSFFAYLSAAGLAGLIITTLVARHHYEFIQALPSLALLALQSAAGVVLALRYNSRVLGNFGVLGGLMAPWFSGQVDPFLLLPYLLIITGAGFILATQKKWPEIFIILLIMASSFVFTAVGQLYNAAKLLAREGVDVTNLLPSDFAINPMVLLIYVFVIYSLIGSAGLIRLATKYKQNTPPKEESFEIVLFTIALVLANLCATGIFNALEWQHIGFLIGAQALVLYGLAEWFKNKNWRNFSVMALCGSLLFILIATLYELRNWEPAFLALVVIIEGVLMCAVGQFSRQKVYEWFGRVAIFLSFAVYLDQPFQDWLMEGLFTIIFVCALVFSVGNSKRLADKIWLGFALLLSSTLILQWSFQTAQIPLLAQAILPTIWGLGLIYSTKQYASLFLRIATGLFLLVFILVLTQQGQLESDTELLVSWGFIALLGGALYWAQKKYLFQTLKSDWLNYDALIMVTFAWLTHTGYSLTEPLITIAWIAMACLLFAGGMNREHFKELRYVGLGIMLIIVTKLYLIDVWQWDTPIRVMAFTALGGALLSISFFYQKTWLKK